MTKDTFNKAKYLIELIDNLDCIHSTIMKMKERPEDSEHSYLRSYSVQLISDLKTEAGNKLIKL